MQAEVAREEDLEPPPKRRLLSSVVKAPPGNEGEQGQAGGPLTHLEPSLPPAQVRGIPSLLQSGWSAQKKTCQPHKGLWQASSACDCLKIAIWRWWEQEGGEGGTGEDGEFDPARREVPAVHKDERVVRRNKRMFGALLLGTLEKFREDDKKLQKSDAFVRRSDSLKRAEQRAREESELLRTAQRQRQMEMRERDLVLKARLAAKADEKALELLFLRWSAHHQRLSSFLCTKTKPAVYFVPAKSCDATQRRLEEQQQELDEWRRQRRDELSSYTQKATTDVLARVETQTGNVLLAGLGPHRSGVVGEHEVGEDVHAAADRPALVEHNEVRDMTSTAGTILEDGMPESTELLSAKTTSSAVEDDNKQVVQDDKLHSATPSPKEMDELV
eukprot:jgi/Mesen1/2130/ME000152S01219